LRGETKTKKIFGHQFITQLLSLLPHGTFNLGCNLVCRGYNANFFEQMAEDLSNFERYLRYRRPEGHVFIQQKDKTFVWVPDGKGAFYTAQVLGEEGDNTKVLIQETGQVSYIAV
jgi:hypothetical protein